ncbi:MAG: hypothetical protein R6X02_20360 [Enhygromyxa sp.]
MRRQSCIASLLTLWAVTLLGCAEEESEPVISPLALVAQQCAAAVGCGCIPGDDHTVQSCTDSLSGTVEANANAAAAAGLLYDADCAARQVQWYEELGCAIQNGELLLEAGCALNCPLYYGYDGPGEECTVIAARASTCAKGLDCVGGICQDTCNNWRLAEGATCYNPANPPTGSCVDGTHCDVGDTNRCVPTPRRGEPCPGNVCRPGDFCNSFAQPEAICESIKAVGEPCLEASACATGYCTDNLCAPYPGAGEPCTGECRDDLYCQSGVCTVKQQLGQSCDFSLPCATGLACNGSVCEQGGPLVCGMFF